MFEKSLQDLVKGLRDCKTDAESQAYVSKSLAEIKEEASSRETPVKANALLKAVYVNMLGYPINFVAFNTIEVMTQERFIYKRAAFLCASQIFSAKTDVIVLCTQLLKKEFQAKSHLQVGLAINCLANIATPELAQDLLSDVVIMLTSSKAYIRKKAVLALYKLYIQFPQGLRLSFDALKRRLSDDNISVTSCAVNVICELARKKPKNYLPLAPELFNILTTSRNNWMLIKVAKLMGALVEEEPRLARKLLEPLANIIQSTPAKSLMYECINTVTRCLPLTKKADGTDAKNAPAVIRLCTDRLREFIRDPDQNLKYLGLMGLWSLMKSHPRVVAEHRELVLKCLVDDDITIRLRALELIAGMVTRKNLSDIVRRLSEHVESAEGAYRDALIDKIIFMCSRDKYEYLEDFAWYISVLIKLAYIQGSRFSNTIASQLIDVCVRVEEVREFAVQNLLPLITGSSFASGNRGDKDPILAAAAWIVGEYATFLPPQMREPVIDALVQPAVLSVSASVQAIYMQCVLKILSVIATAELEGTVVSRKSSDEDPSVLRVAASLASRLNPFTQSPHVEVQERATVAQGLLASLGIVFTPVSTPEAEKKKKEAAEAAMLALLEGEDNAAAAPPAVKANAATVASVLRALFDEPLKPVKPSAQKKVAVPDGLNLDAWINAPTELEPDEFLYATASFMSSFGDEGSDEEYAGTSAGKRKSGGGRNAGSDDDLWSDLAPKAASSRSGAGGGPRAYNPFMIQSSSTPKSGAASTGDSDIPIESLPSVDASIFKDFGADPKKKKGKGESDKPKPVYHVADDEEAPDNAESSEEETTRRGDALADIDLLAPLRADEVMPMRTHHVVKASDAKKHKKGSSSKKSSSKKDDDGAAAAAAAAAADDKPKKSKKSKKEVDEDAAPKKSSKKKSSEGVSGTEVLSTPVMSALAGAASKVAGLSLDDVVFGKSGDAVALGDPYTFVLHADKVVKVSYTVTASPGKTAKDAATALVKLKVEGKSSKKGVEWVDIQVDGPVVVAGLAAGNTPGALRIGAAIKPKSKSKDSKAVAAQKSSLPVTLDNPITSLALRTLLTYKIAKSDETVSQEAVLLLPAACLLVPTTVKLDDYQKIVTAPTQPFFDEKSTISVPADSTADAVITSVGAVFRAYVVQQTSRATILFAKSFQGHLVTALLKPSDVSIAVTIKSTCAGHATAMTRDVLAIVSPGDLPAPTAPSIAPPPIVSNLTADSVVGIVGVPSPGLGAADAASVPALMEFVPPPAPTRKYLRDPSVSIDDIDPMADTAADAPVAAEEAAVATNVEDFLNDDDDDGPVSAGAGGAGGAEAGAEDDDAPIGISRVSIVKGEEDEDD